MVIVLFRSYHSCGLQYNWAKLLISGYSNAKRGREYYSKNSFGNQNAIRACRLSVWTEQSVIYQLFSSLPVIFCSQSMSGRLSNSRWRKQIYFMLKIMSLYGFVSWVEWETFASNGCLYSQISAERESYRWTDKGSSDIVNFPWVVQVWGGEVTGAKYTVMHRKRKAWCYWDSSGQAGPLEAQWTGELQAPWLLGQGILCIPWWTGSCGRASCAFSDGLPPVSLCWQTQRGCGIQTKAGCSAQGTTLLWYRKNSFTERVVKQWNRVPREIMRSSVLEMFQKCVHVVLKEVV